MNLATVWRRSNLLRVGASILLVLVLAALLQPLLNRLLIGDVSPITMGSFDPYLPPSSQHWLGTDRWGRDWMAQLILGLRYSLLVGTLAGAAATCFAVVFAFIAGYKGGALDTVLRTVTDMVLVVPSWPILVTLAAYISGLTVPVMALLLAAFSWPWPMRTIRAQVMSLRKQPYVDLAKITDLHDLEIIFQELLPNMLPFLGVGLANATVGAMLAETGLALIGLGPANIASLGLMINWAMSWGALALGKWQMMFAPVICLILVFVSLHFINIGLEEAYNPRLQRITGG